jgi:hypothetical protein
LRGALQPRTVGAFEQRRGEIVVRAGVLIASLSVLAGAGLLTGLSAAQAPTPTVTVTLGPGSGITVAGAEALAAGPTRFEVRGQGRRSSNFGLVALRPGQTLATLRQAVARSQRSPTPVKRVATFEASGSATGAAPYVTTVDLKPGVTYVAANVGERPQAFRYAEFTVGTTPSGAVRPAPAATVGLYDYAFGMPSTLPRRGTVRFENRGDRLHIAVAFPLRRGASRVAAVRAMLRNDFRRAGRLIDERGITEPVGIISGGAVNDVEVNFPRAGNYVMVCFIEDGERGNPPHNSLGMVTPFRVR